MLKQVHLIKVLVLESKFGHVRTTYAFIDPVWWPLGLMVVWRLHKIWAVSVYTDVKHLLYFGQFNAFFGMLDMFCCIKSSFFKYFLSHDRVKLWVAMLFWKVCIFKLELDITFCFILNSVTYRYDKSVVRLNISMVQ